MINILKSVTLLSLVIMCSSCLSYMTRYREIDRFSGGGKEVVVHVWLEPQVGNMTTVGTIFADTVFYPVWLPFEVGCGVSALLSPEIEIKYGPLGFLAGLLPMVTVAPFGHVHEEDYSPFSSFVLGPTVIDPEAAPLEMISPAEMKALLAAREGPELRQAYIDLRVGQYERRTGKAYLGPPKVQFPEDEPWGQDDCQAIFAWSAYWGQWNHVVRDEYDRRRFRCLLYFKRNRIQRVEIGRVRSLPR